MSVVFENGYLAVSIGKRLAHVPFAMEGEIAIVSLDDVAQWQTGEEISIDDLARISLAIEKACDQRGLDVEFE